MFLMERGGMHYVCDVRVSKIAGANKKLFM